MEEQEEFLRDMFEVSSKFIDVAMYMQKLVSLQMGRYTAQKQKQSQETVIVEKQDYSHVKQIATYSNLSKEEEESMENVRHRADGRWEYRLQIEGKRTSIISNTRSKLLEKIKEFKKNLKTQTQPSHTRGNQKLVDFARYWFETFKSPSIEEKTRKMYRDTIKNLERFDVTVQNINAINLQEFLNKFPPTRTKELVYMVLKLVLKKAYELKMTKEDFSQHLVKGKIERTTREILNIDDQSKLIGSLKGKTDSFSMSLYVYLLTGCRPLEINYIKKKHIGEDKVFIDGTKRKASKRFVRISSTFREMLLEYAKDLAPNDFLFKFTYDALQDKFGQLKEKLKIKGSIYCLRHTYSTNLYYLGASDKERQTSMGHASSAMTNDVYTHIDFSMNETNLKKIYGHLYPNYKDR